MTGIATPPSEVSIDASQKASASASQSAGVELFLLPGQPPPPLRTEPNQ
jgi:hypothetical protein